MATANHVDEIQVDLPSLDYGPGFVIQMTLLVIATLCLEFGLVFFGAVNDETRIQSTNPFSVNAFVRNGSNQLDVLPVTAAVFDNKLWYCGATPTGTTRLISIDLKSGKPSETGITFKTIPLGILEMENQLWIVSDTVVNRIQGDQMIPRFPRRILIHPSKPFVYEGRMAIIDKNKNDVYALLVWNDGEWSEIAKVDAPKPFGSTPGFPTELRAISSGKMIYLFFAEMPTVWFREGILLDTDPPSALRTENRRLVTDNLPELPVERVKDINRKLDFQSKDWTPAPISAGYGYSWDVAIINDELWAFQCTTDRTKPVQRFVYRSKTWTPVPVSNSLPTSSFRVASGEHGYLVSDTWQVTTVDGTKIPGMVPTNDTIPTFSGVDLRFLALIALQLAMMAILGIGTRFLMGIHRKPEYVYGKRFAVRASILRRGIARMIDMFVTLFPAFFWMAVVLNLLRDPMSGIDYLGFTIFSIFGMWLIGILGISFTQGRFGFTPGKWLCGIRTFQTTLRPCGMLRSLARELLIYIDCLFFMTWLPGVLSIAFTQKWQRVGDLIADTVVVIDPKQSWSSTFYPSRSFE